MGNAGQDRARALLVRAGDVTCALPLAHVVETMRPLPTTSLAGAPAFVRGVAVIRGGPVPVVDLERLLGSSAGAPPTRYVVVRSGERRFALAVSSTAGVFELAEIEATPLPLVSEACRSAIEALGALDAELVLVLAAARLVPPEAWAALAAGSARA